MDLWIRSQDKMALAKFDLCTLEKYDDKYMFIADHYKNMGTYSTKERALEVLDKIQEKIDNVNMLSVRPRRDYVFYSTTIYEMPEE